MFNIVSIIIFGLIVFFMNTSLPFLYFFYIFFNVLSNIFILIVWCLYGGLKWNRQAAS